MSEVKMTKSKTTGKKVQGNGTVASYQRKMRDLRLGKPGAVQPTPADRKAWRAYYQARRDAIKAQKQKDERAAKRAANKAAKAGK